MATHLSSFGELLAMPLEDLRKDLAAQRTLVRKMRLGIEVKKEKDTARFRREKRQLARMLTAYRTLSTEKERARPASFQAETGGKPGGKKAEIASDSKDAGLKQKPKSRKVSSRAPKTAEAASPSTSSAS